ncbi:MULTISPECIES: hypothetical protein [unclassified Breznakia]|uniref:hypothetical protein n=1 Tax=unclassified Breznakia TaxID=2623764 RepID=UPI002474F394|nr:MULTISPECIES: hypothetical protein [unclassified Breznakia]MDH6367166.1 hypothetical protein [Breznakia sp. PH1-1]MDH6404414.1 hypothetical protein [Breznakia sp. PF1-11]MDH6412123.1 hypothetical protein [Breznakia sp. PFB1-11]MDH6414402.1 hypothetical protein [Breznakia sp. PFB1-14]MDH6416668.1 hypothetical protein [Breznakia sp. PFB1-4]
MNIKTKAGFVVYEWLSDKVIIKGPGVSSTHFYQTMENIKISRTFILKPHISFTEHSKKCLIHFNKRDECHIVKIIEYINSYKKDREVKQDISVESPLSESKELYDDEVSIDIKVVGTSFKQNEIKKLFYLSNKLLDNEKYQDMSTKEIKEALQFEDEIFEFQPVEYSNNEIRFINEPDNEFDKEAVKVVIIEDNKEFHVGYIPKQQINDFNNYREIKNVEAILSGGKYKTLDDDLESVTTEEYNYVIDLIFK